MKDFLYYTPTEVHFGAQSEDALPELIKKYGGTKVLIHYGGQSAKKSGLIDKIHEMLNQSHIDYVDLGGVVPNPLLTKVYEGIELGKKEGIDFVLAVGGGSVIDSSKGIAYGMLYDGDVWDLYLKKAKAKATLPVGVVLTIPAAGSEMSPGSVITNPEGLLKRAYNDDISRPKFAIMNPERTYTLPPYQTACGITDIMMHTMERFFSLDDDMTLTDNLAIALLRTVKDCATDVLRHPDDYRLRAQIMWAGSVAHNGLTGCGTTSDFATHMLEHELSAIYGVAHGAGLAAIWSSWARYTCPHHINRFVKFAVEVMDIPNDYTHPETTALHGIEAMELFYKSINMPTSISELLGEKLTEEEIEELAMKCSSNRTVQIGNFQKLGYDDMIRIYQMANDK